MLTTSGTHPWSFVTQIFHSGQQSHGGNRKTFEMITSTKTLGTLGSVASLLAAILYQGNSKRNHKLWNIVSTEIYILHMHLYVVTNEWKVYNWKIEIIAFVENFTWLTVMEYLCHK